MGAADKAGNKLPGADQLTADPSQSPGKNQNQHGGNNASDAADDTFHKSLRLHDFSGNIQKPRRDKAGKSPQREPRRRIITNGFGKARPLEEASHISHAQYSADNQHQDRQSQIRYPAPAILLAGSLLLGNPLRHSSFLSLLHRAEIPACKRNDKNHR